MRPDADLDPAGRGHIETDYEPAAAPREVAEPRRPGLLSPKDALQPERLPPRPTARKRRPGVLAAISGFLTFLLVGFFLAGFALVGVQRKIREPGPLTADKVVYIAPGTEVPDIIAKLESDGVITNPLLMNTALLVEGARSKLRAGEYMFKQAASLQDVMDTLVSGKQILHPITIPEGLTSEQIMQRLRDNDILTGDIRETPKEGTLLPETYKVARSDARSNVVRKMQDDQRKVVDQIWARRSPDLPIKTSYELITLASIVERETGKADERPHVASVFINRLNKRMRLQSDPTIVYGLVQGRGTLGRGILRSEVDKWTPYNTYQIDGLPPGPIANPGRAALEAVANPSRTSDLYFVADGTGGHVFASTLEEHQRNVARWRQIERDAKERTSGDVDKAPAPMSPAGGSVPGPTPARPGQRSEWSPLDSFGGLPTSLARLSVEKILPEPDLSLTPPVERFADPLSEYRARRTVAMIVRDRSNAVAVQRPAEPLAVAAVAPGAGLRDKPAQVYAFGPDIEALGLQVRGVQGRSDLLDGPGDDSAGSVDMTSYPVSAQRRNEQKALAARYGLPSESDVLPPEPATMEASALTVPGPGQRHARAFDASEGTPLDPLRNRSWDLTHAQVVPGMTLR